jgi:hypothetical protein
MACACQELPRLQGYQFLLSSGIEVLYYLGQCSRCRTIFWEEG